MEQRVHFLGNRIKIKINLIENKTFYYNASVDSCLPQQRFFTKIIVCFCITERNSKTTSPYFVNKEELNLFKFNSVT